MKYTIDTENRTLTTDERELPLYSPEAFEILSQTWLKVGWNAHYHYTFTWMGRPALQLPEDLIRLQEVIWELKPDVIIETGVAMGGSLLFYASLCHALNKGGVIGIDIDLRPHNRQQLEAHPLASYLTLIDGSSADPDTVSNLNLNPSDTVLIILDSNHSREHVLKELELFAPLVSVDSYLVVADGFKRFLSNVPRGKDFWSWDNPSCAVEEFLKTHPEFILEEPERCYDRSSIRSTVTHFHNGWLKKRAVC